METFRLEDFSTLQISKPNALRNTRIYRTKYSELIYLLGKKFYRSDLCQHVYIKYTQQKQNINQITFDDVMKILYYGITTPISPDSAITITYSKYLSSSSTMDCLYHKIKMTLSKTLHILRRKRKEHTVHSIVSDFCLKKIDTDVDIKVLLEDTKTILYHFISLIKSKKTYSLEEKGLHNENFIFIKHLTQGRYLHVKPFCFSFFYRELSNVLSFYNFKMGELCIRITNLQDKLNKLKDKLNESNDNSYYFEQVVEILFETIATYFLLIEFYKNKIYESFNIKTFEEEFASDKKTSEIENFCFLYLLYSYFLQHIIYTFSISVSEKPLFLKTKTQRLKISEQKIKNNLISNILACANSS